MSVLQPYEGDPLDGLTPARTPEPPDLPKRMQFTFTDAKQRREVQAFMLQNGLTNGPETVRYLIALGLSKTPLEPSVAAAYRTAYNEANRRLKIYMGTMLKGFAREIGIDDYEGGER